MTSTARDAGADAQPVADLDPSVLAALTSASGLVGARREPALAQLLPAQRRVGRDDADVGALVDEPVALGDRLERPADRRGVVAPLARPARRSRAASSPADVGDHDVGALVRRRRCRPRRPLRVAEDRAPVTTMKATPMTTASAAATYRRVWVRSDASRTVLTGHRRRVATSSSAVGSVRWARISPSAMHQHVVGVRRGVQLVGDHHDGLAELAHGAAQEVEHLRRRRRCRGCRSARRRRRCPARRSRRGRSPPAAAGRRRARTAGGRAGR